MQSCVPHTALQVHLQAEKERRFGSHPYEGANSEVFKKDIFKWRNRGRGLASTAQIGVKIRRVSSLYDV